MLRGALVGLVLATSTVAAADPLTLTVGAGVRNQSLHGELRATPQADPIVDPTDLGVAIDLVAGYRLTPYLAIGGRFGFSKLDVQKQWGRSSDLYLLDGYERTPLDFAAVVQLEVSRLWLQPWIGVQAMYSADQSRAQDMDTLEMSGSDLTTDWSSSLSFGATVGVDIVKGTTDRMAVFAGAQSGTGGYSAITFGVGYRR